MSITSQRHPLPPRSTSRDAGINGMLSPAQRSRRSRPVMPGSSGVPALMGRPNHAPGVPVMGAPSHGLHLDVMGGPDVGPDLDPMGGPDTGQPLLLLGESHPTFIGSLFAQRRSLR
jgi:hypothetical protein